MRRALVVIDAPSNLGLRPPEEGSVPGCYKLAGALRDHRLLSRLGAEDDGVVVPPRYRARWNSMTVRNAEAIAGYSRSLAERVGAILDLGSFPIVLGGDCSILLGNALALRRRGRYGLVFIDGHLDFRHLGNSDAVGAAAGEDLALVTGRGVDELVNIDGLRPYVSERDVVALGARQGDEYTEEVRSLGIPVTLAPAIRDRAAEVAAEALAHLEAAGVDGFWIHLDLDALDCELLPAVDSPEPNGLRFGDLSSLLRQLVASDLAAGIELTIFDPDLDPDGSQARAVTDVIVVALTPAS